MDSVVVRVELERTATHVGGGRHHPLCVGGAGDGAGAHLGGRSRSCACWGRPGKPWAGAVSVCGCEATRSLIPWHGFGCIRALLLLRRRDTVADSGARVVLPDGGGLWRAIGAYRRIVEQGRGGAEGPQLEGSGLSGEVCALFDGRRRVLGLVQVADAAQSAAAWAAGECTWAPGLRGAAR